MPGVYQDELTKRDRVESIVRAFKTERSTFEAHWRELGDFFRPRRTRFWAGDRNRGDKRNQNIINSTGRFAARTLQSGMHAGLTSPARPWMKLTLPDRDLAEYKPVAEWLHVLSERMLRVFAITNLYTVLPTVYGDMGIFGTAAMALIEDSRDLFRAYSYPIGSYWLGQDSRGLVTSFAREYQMTVRQVVEQFGLKENGRDIDWSTISSTVKTLWDRSDYEAGVDVTWLVQPNEQASAQRLEARYLPFSSCHFENGSQEKKFLRESGFRRFPIMAPRWDITGEDTYGTESPGMDALGDNKQLQLMERKKAQAIAKLVDPPLVGPSTLRSQKTSLIPGDITYADTRDGMQGLRAIHEIQLRLDHLSMDMQLVELRIKRSFFEDLFLMLATSDPIRGAQPPTAREVDERHEEKLLALGPVLERTDDELLDPVIDRVFEMMLTENMVPDPPPELDGIRLSVEYISILHQAQKMVGVTGQDRFLQTTLPLAEVYPGVANKVDINQAIDNYAEMLGVDPRIVRPTKDAEAMLAQQQQAQQQQLDAEQAKNTAAAAKSASETKMGQDSALDRIVQQVAG